MTRLLRSSAMVVSAVLVLSCMDSPAEAGDGWKLPLWRPFASKDATTTMNVVRRPTATPVQQTRSSSQSTTSKVWSDMTAGTKKAWDKTVDVVTLKPIRRSLSPQPSTSPKLGLKSDPRKVKNAHTTHDNPGPLSSLFRPREVKKPSTVDEFFSQERP